jgi:hypothetical protein
MLIPFLSLDKLVSGDLSRERGQTTGGKGGGGTTDIQVDNVSIDR